jgi:hypothetical protein
MDAKVGFQIVVVAAAPAPARGDANSTELHGEHQAEAREAATRPGTRGEHGLRRGSEHDKRRGEHRGEEHGRSTGGYPMWPAKPRRSSALFYSPAAAVPAPLADRIARLCGEGARVKKARPTSSGNWSSAMYACAVPLPYPTSKHATMHRWPPFVPTAEDELHMSVQCANGE